MRIPEKILITTFYKGNFVDIEVPTDIQIKEIKDKIVDVLNVYFKENLINDTVPGAINLYYENKPLDNDKMLINYGIWDGSIIDAR